MLSEYATENYLKAIVKALAPSGRERLGTGDLARLLGVTSGTATTMIKKLQRLGYVEYESHRGCRLTETGRAYGLRILRRHRLLETFLAGILGLDWADIHDEAENLEHAASEMLIDAIDAYLGKPHRDPHGDPIPSKNQTEYLLGDVPLPTVEEGRETRISRVAGDKERLAYYRSEGLVPGAAVRVEKKRDASGLAVVVVEGREKPLALAALEGVFVEEPQEG